MAASSSPVSARYRALRWPADSWKLLQEPGWQLAVWLLITLRVGLGLIAVLSIHLQPITGVGGELLNLIIRGGEPWSAFLSTWQRFDALWYQQIVEHGYHAGDNTVHFQPLFPLLVRVASLPLAGQVVLAELVVASLAFVVAMALLYRVVQLDANRAVAQLTVLLTAFFPLGFFLVAPYTESLYLALTLAAFWFARHGKPWAAGLAGLGAGMTRTVAIFLVLPLAFEYLRGRDQEGRGTPRGCPHPGFGLLAATLPAVGFIATIVYDRAVVGEQRSVFQVGQHFGDRFLPPWTALADGWKHVTTTGDPVEILNLSLLLAFVVIALLMLRRLPLAYGLYVLPYLLLLASRESEVSPLESVARYLVVLFPCFVMLAIWLVRRPALAAGILVLSGGVQVLLFEYWVHFGFVA